MGDVVVKGLEEVVRGLEVVVVDRGVRGCEGSKPGTYVVVLEAKHRVLVTFN